MVAVETAAGEYTVFELLGGYDVDVGDEFAGDLHSIGGETLYNTTKMERMDASIQATNCTKKNALILLNII